MSLLDDVSIVVTPNGYKAGELYAVIPVPTEGAEEVTNGDFATDSNWTKGTGWTISGGTANASATTATLVHIGSLGTVANVRYLISMDVTVISGTVRVRNSSGWVETEISSSNTYNYYAILGSSSSLVIEGISSFTGSINSISIKEYTSADMDVTRATDATRVDENGLIEDVLSNVPRIDYTGGGCPHILAEPQRTNEITYSEDFSDSSWSKSNCTVGSESVSSPSGVIGVSSVTNTSIFGRISTIKNLTNAVSYNYSFWCKNIDITTPLSIHLNNSGITLDTFTPTSEWVKYVFTWTSSSTITETIAIQDRIGSALGSYMIWGAQLEEGSYSTSYIPTSGSTVTRNQDHFTRDGIGSLINSTEGVLFVEMAALSDDNTFRIISLCLNSSNRASINYSTTSNTIKAQYINSGSATANLSFLATDITLTSKVAFKYKLNDFALWVDGIEVASSTSGSVLPLGTFSKLDFSVGDSSLPFYGKVKQLQVYDTALTDTQLTSLTS